MKALIIGGGISGLSIAVGLKRIGIDCSIFEKSSSLRPDGAGITVWNNGLQALSLLMPDDSWRQFFCDIENIHLISRRGKKLGQMPVQKLSNEFGAGASMVHRQDLIHFLAQNLAAQIFLNAKVASYSETESLVQVQLEDGSIHTGDFLIGADGINTMAKVKPRVFCGHVAWRGVCEATNSVFAKHHSFIAIGCGSYFACHHISGDRLYWIGTKASQNPLEIPPTEWQTQLQKNFLGWTGAVDKVINSTPKEALIVNNIFRCEDVEFSVGKRSLFLGDAAHASAPQMGQGACLALEDALVLSQLLAKNNSDIYQVFKAFAQIRSDRARKIVSKSQAVADLYHMTNPITCWLRNLSVQLSTDDMNLKRASWATQIRFN